MAAMSGVLARCTVRSAFVDILRMAMAACDPRKAITIEHGQFIGDGLEALCHIFRAGAAGELRRTWVSGCTLGCPGALT